MSQTQTTNKTNSSRTSRSRNSPSTTASKRTAAKVAITPEAVVPEVMPVEPLPSDASSPDDAIQTSPVQEEELKTVTEMEATSAASEALDIPAAYAEEMDSDIEADNEENSNNPTQAEVVIESSTLHTNEDDVPTAAELATEVPVEQAEPQSITEDASKPAIDDTVENAESAVQAPLEAKPTVGAEKPAKKVKGLDRQLRATSVRYQAACLAVSDLRTQFLSALDAKADLLNTRRRGEAVPVQNDEIDAIDQEIRVAKEALSALQERKRQLKFTTPGLDQINRTIRELSRKRNSARAAKQKIFEEEAGQLAAQSVGASANL